MDSIWHIGVIKFFDRRKGFGYIVSNHCGMNSSVYEQDFYVDSSSFIEESAKADSRLVVFQWEAQGRGKDVQPMFGIIVLNPKKTWSWHCLIMVTMSLCS